MTIRLLIRKLSSRVRRLTWRLSTAAFGGDRVYSFRLPGGARFDYPLGSAIGEDLYAGWFEPAKVAFVRGHLKPGDVVLDLGANAGLYTGVASDTALSSLAEISREDQQITDLQTVTTIRLDDAVTQFWIRPVALTKMDVEGAEKLALDGATNLLSRTSAPLTMLFEAFAKNTGVRLHGSRAAEPVARPRVLSARLRQDAHPSSDRALRPRAWHERVQLRRLQEVNGCPVNH